MELLHANEQGRLDNDIERALQKTDNYYSRVLAKVLADEDLNRQDRTTFALFVADMLLRVPVARESTNVRLNRSVRQWADKTRQHFIDQPGALDAYVETRNAESDDKLTAEYVLNLLDPSSFRPQATSQTAMGMAYQMLPLCAHILLDMGWVFISSKGADYFITSDCPVTIMNPYDLEADQGILNSQVEVSFPLSRNMAFLAWWRHAGTAFSSAKVENVLSLNARATLYGKRFLVAPKPIFPGSDQIEEIWKSTRVIVPNDISRACPT